MDKFETGVVLSSMHFDLILNEILSFLLYCIDNITKIVKMVLNCLKIGKYFLHSEKIMHQVNTFLSTFHVHVLYF